MNKKKIIFTPAFYVMVVSLLVFMIAAFCAVNIDAVSVFNLNILKQVNTFSSAHPLDLPIIITDLGDKYGMVYPILLALGTFVYFNRFQEPVLLILATESAHIITKITKDFFAVARPPAELNLIDPHSFSFPSGHSLVSMVFYGFLVYFCFKYIKINWIKYSLAVIIGVFILLIGFTRIYLGVHYPTDVIGGFSLGLFWISMWIILYRLYINKSGKFDEI